MKCFVVLGLLAVASAQLASYSYQNPAGVTFRGTGFNPGFAFGPAQPLAAAPLAAPAPVAAPIQYAAPVSPAYHHQHYPAYQHYPQYQQYYNTPAVAAAPVQYAPHYAAPAVAVTQKVGYAHHQVPVQVPGVADVPVTKLALTQGVTQKLVDVAQPAVSNRRIKVRRPALRKEFYDIEHRIIVRPAGSATLELSQPISKHQQGETVITPTDYQQIAPVVRYGLGRQIVDGPGVSQAAHVRANLARGVQAGPAPFPQPQPQQLRAAPPPPQQQPQQQQPEFRGPPQQQQQPQFRQQQGPQEPDFRPAPQGSQPQPEFRAAPAPAPRQRPLQLRPEGPQFRSADAEIIEAGAGPAPRPQQLAPQQPRPVGPAQGPTPRLAIQDMPVEIQQRLLELLSARGGTVTEVLGENGQANSASVLEVANDVQNLDLQGGEKITTRRIVVTRPIETIQEIDVQEPATKIHRHAVNVPTLFKTPVQGIARVPVSLPGVKNVATPVLQTHYAHPQYAAAPYAAGPAYAY